MSTYPMLVRDLPGALTTLRKAAQNFQPEQVTWEEQRDNVALLKEITENRKLSEAFMISRGLVATWNMAEVLLRAYVEPIKWKGSNDQYRSNIGVPILAENFYSLLSAFQQILFAGNRPFLIDPGPSTKLETAQAQEALLASQLKVAGPKGTSAKLQIRSLGYDGFLYGAGVVIAGWTTLKKKRLVYKKGASKSVPLNDSGVTGTVHDDDDNIEPEWEEYEVNQPTVEHVPIRRVRVAPDCRRGDVRTASWRGRIIYLDSYELDDFRDVEGYNIPTREQLIALTTPYKTEPTTHNVMETQTGAITNANPVQQPTAILPKAIPESQNEFANVDPLARKFEIFEYITDKRIGWVLEDQYLIRNSPNDGDVEMYSWNYRESPDAFFGYGIPLFTGDFQHIAQGVVNYYFDNKALDLMGTYEREEGVSISSQPNWMFPGRVAPKGIKLADRGAAKDTDLALVDKLKAWAAAISGAGAGIQGINPGSPGDMRTKQGVETLNSGEQVKQADLIDMVCEQVFIPMLTFFVAQNRKLKPSQLRKMLSENLADAEKVDPIDMLNANYKITISAGAKLQARMALNNALGYIQSILQQPTFGDQLSLAGKKINWEVFLRVILEGFGFPYTEQLIVDMTAEDKERLKQQQGNPGAKIMGDLLKIQAQTSGKQSIDNNQAENRALLETQKAMFEHSDREAEAAFNANGNG
jgi:hypothetical protein